MSARRRDAAAVERLRTRTATWEDRHDPALAGLLALAREADRLAPLPAPAPQARRRRLPALAGLATTAVAGCALVVLGTAGGPAAPAPAPRPTLSAQGSEVSQLLTQVRSDLVHARAATSATSRQSTYRRAAALLDRATRLTRALPPGEQEPLRRTSTELEQELDAQDAPPAAGPDGGSDR